MAKQVIGIIGCGNISDIYLKNLTGRFSRFVTVGGCTDLNRELCVQKAEKYGITAYESAEALLADPVIDIILNLTTPPVHASVDLAAIHAGKHCYSEKPLSISLAEARNVKSAAEEKGVRVGCAPDTFLGGGLQCARTLIDEGAVGRVTSVNAAMTCHGHESWHPNPDFYYQSGGGPLFDMGPYYLTALVSLLGPIVKVSGMGNRAFRKRVITSSQRYGETVDVEAVTHMCGTMEFANGAVGTLVTSFDVWKSNLPKIEIHGTEGSLSLPDPNGFGGSPDSLSIFRNGGDDWERIELSDYAYRDNARGLGLVDLALAVEQDRPHRASLELAWNVLESMTGFDKSAEKDHAIPLSSSLEERPEPLEKGLEEGEIWN